MTFTIGQALNILKEAFGSNMMAKPASKTQKGEPCTYFWIYHWNGFLKKHEEGVAFVGVIWWYLSDTPLEQRLFQTEEYFRSWCSYLAHSLLRVAKTSLLNVLTPNVESDDPLDQEYDIAQLVQCIHDFDPNWSLTSEVTSVRGELKETTNGITYEFCLGVEFFSVSNWIKPLNPRKGLEWAYTLKQKVSSGEYIERVSLPWDVVLLGLNTKDPSWLHNLSMETGYQLAIPHLLTEWIKKGVPTEEPKHP